MFAKNSSSDEVMDMNALQCCSTAAEMLVFTKWIEKSSRSLYLRLFCKGVVCTMRAKIKKGMYYQLYVKCKADVG